MSWIIKLFIKKKEVKFENFIWAHLKTQFIFFSMSNFKLKYKIHALLFCTYVIVFKKIELLFSQEKK